MSTTVHDHGPLQGAEPSYGNEEYDDSVAADDEDRLALAVKDLATLSSQLLAAAESSEDEFLSSERDQRVVDSVRTFAVTAVTSAVDRLSMCAFELNQRLEDAEHELLVTGVRASALQMRVQVCSGSLSKAALKQQQAPKSVPRYHKVYLLAGPRGVAPGPPGMGAELWGTVGGQWRMVRERFHPDLDDYEEVTINSPASSLHSMYPRTTWQARRLSENVEAPGRSVGGSTRTSKLSMQRSSLSQETDNSATGSSASKPSTLSLSSSYSHRRPNLQPGRQGWPLVPQEQLYRQQMGEGVGGQGTGQEVEAGGSEGSQGSAGAGAGEWEPAPRNPAVARLIGQHLRARSIGEHDRAEESGDDERSGGEGKVGDAEPRRLSRFQRLVSGLWRRGRSNSIG